MTADRCLSRARCAPPARRTVAPRRRAPLGLLALAVALSGCAYTVNLEPPPAASESSKILTTDGQILATLDAGEHRVPVTFDEIAPTLRDAVVAIEDHRFWEHRGIDFRAVGRALAANTEAGEIAQGGSTITQQYVRNVMLGREQTVSRKLREAALAFEVEKRFSKEEILERYLNLVYFGAGAYGVEAAADRYFGKDADELDLAESALLAGLIQAPERYNPYHDPDAALARRGVVLEQMAEYGFVTEEEAVAAAAEPLEVVELRDSLQYPAGHFVEQVKQFILDDPAFGATPDERRHLLFQGGLEIETTLDMRLQLLAQDAIAKVLVDPAHDPEAALVALDPRTGHVLAYVGGRDFFGDTPYAKFDLASQGRRQAGSAFKPFVLAAALADGIPLDTEYPAPSSIEIPLRGEAPWKVSNFEGDGFGTADLVEATVFSVNTVYAQLVMDTGPADVVALADRMGIDSPLLPVPSAALGTNGVSVLDMASAYATFAADGEHAPPQFVTKVTGPDGTIYYEASPARERVLDAEIARQVSAVLQQVVGRGTGVNARIGRPVAGKTGTGEEHRDAWFVGYTPQLVTAIWVGFPEAEIEMRPPTTRAEVTGGLWPAQIFNLFEGAALAEEPVVEFTPPSDGAADVTPRPLPDVQGMPALQAVELLEDAGYDVTVYEQPSRDYPPGTVIGQNPPAHALAVAGDEIEVWVANGRPDTALVPDLLRLDDADARAALDAVGLVVDAVVEPEPEPGFVEPGQVWKQAPIAGTEVDAGTVVQIWVDG